MYKSDRAVRTQQAAIVNGSKEIARISDIKGSENLRFDITIVEPGTATGTVQWYVQDSIDGITWDDVISSNTFAFGAAVVTQRFAVALSVAPSFTQGSAVSNQTLAVGTTRPGPIGPFVRIIEKASGILGTPTGPTYRIGLSIK